MASSYAEFVRKLHADKAFRRRFASDPRKALRAHGLDPDLLDLPDRIDLDALERRIANRVAGPLPDMATVESASPQELWDKFNFIRLKDDLGLLEGVTTTGVIYGTTATTSTTSVVTSQGSPSGTDREIARLGRLRDLARMPASTLRFAVKGPDGRVVHDLNVSAMRALVEKLR